MTEALERTFGKLPPGLLHRRYRNELLALVVLIVAVQFSPRSTPFELYVLGLSGAVAIASHASAIRQARLKAVDSR